ncbi:MAG: stress response translation initiation inhibitor YciH [Candidatus Njordarchaeia archaeon]
MAKDDDILQPFDFETQISLLSQKVRIFQETRRRRHVVTIIAGLDDKTIDLKKIASDLKRYCATGGTHKVDKKFGNVIILQGDHIQKVIEYLTKHLGIPRENIEVL